MTDPTTTDRHTCSDRKAAAGPAWECPRCSAASAVSLPPANQTAPRKTAEAVLAVVEAALGDTLVPSARAEALAGITAVLPATTGQTAEVDRLTAELADYDERCQRLTAGRAAVVHEAVRRVHAEYDDIEDGDDDAVGLRRGLAIAEDVLRRMADETPAAETEAEPTAEQIARDHVTTLHLIGEQLTTIEGWFWEHLADVRAAGQPAAGARQDETSAAPCVECDHPKAVHEEGDDPVTPGQCADCPDGEDRHDYRTAAVRQDGAQR